MARRTRPTARASTRAHDDARRARDARRPRVRATLSSDGRRARDARRRRAAMARAMTTRGAVATRLDGRRGDAKTRARGRGGARTATARGGTEARTREGAGGTRARGWEGTRASARDARTGEDAAGRARTRAVIGARERWGDGARGRGWGARVESGASDAAVGEGERKPTKGKGVSNLLKRTVSSLFMVAVGGVVIFAGGWPWALAMALFNGASCVEYFGMVREMNKELPYPPPEWCINLCVAACASLPVLLHATGGKMTSIIVATVISFTAICAALIVNEESHFNEFTSSLFGLIYCGFLPTFWVKLRGMSGVSLATPDSLLHHWPAWLGGPGIWTLGLAATITIVLSVVSADVGAYAFGKNFGKNKLTAVSPNKTVEGAIGGLLACAGTCAALFSVMGWPGTAWQGAFLGVTVFFTSVFGDLLESVMKRNATMKDSGNLIPGHGGLLDRFDSYIFTGSVTYFFVIAVLGGFRRVFSVGYY